MVDRSDMKQQGAALIIVLALVSIATVIAVQLLVSSQWSSARIERQIRMDEAWRLQQGLEDWAMALLARDQARDPGRDSRDDFWARPLPATPIPGGTVAVRLTDLGGRLNLNSLAASEPELAEISRQRFRRLLRILGLPETIQSQVLDWLDTDSIARPGGHEMTPASAVDVAANRRLLHLDQLLLLPSVDESVLARLRPHVMVAPLAGPRGAAFNINTASPELLQSLAEDLPPATARKLAQPPREGWRSVDEFLEQAALADWRIPPQGLGVASHWFQLNGEIRSGARQFQLFSFVERNGSRYHVHHRRQGQP